jgi:L-asparaginase/Glu-tRNA(Gln) amidotransferase subunit D
MLIKLFHKTEMEGTPATTSSYDDSIAPIQNLGKTKQKENYRPISLMSIESKTLNKIFKCQISQHITQIIHYYQVGFILGM